MSTLKSRLKAIEDRHAAPDEVWLSRPEDEDSDVLHGPGGQTMTRAELARVHPDALVIRVRYVSKPSRDEMGR